MTTGTWTRVDAAKDAFAKVFNRLCVALRATDTDAATLQVYYDALQDVPPDAVAAGAAALTKEPGRKWFPTTGEWRHAADAAVVAQLRAALPAARRDPWRHECGDCEDTGWILGLVCDGSLEKSSCGRSRVHAAHDYTRACCCRPTNRTWQRHQQVGAGA